MWFTIAGAALQAAQMLAQQQQARATVQQQQQQQALQSQMLWQQQEQTARQQRDLLKRQLASNRAALAGGGLGFAGGSGAALLAGLANRTEQGIADRYDQASLQHQARFPAQPGSSAAQNLLDGWQKSQEVFSIFRPFLPGSKGQQ
jgi:hypothetical protein